MTLDDFIKKWTEKPVDFDGIYPNQCMDLMHQYIYEVLGLTDKRILAASKAYQVFTNFDNIIGHEYFDKISNTPNGIPQKGDIFFFGTYVGSYGHVCIYIEGDVWNFASFEANWPTGSLPHIQSHNYNGALGWLRFKGQPQIPPVTSCEQEVKESINRTKEEIKTKLLSFMNNL